MARFLHVADLHLSPEEYDYSAGVLKEIVGAAAALDVDAVLVAGHLTSDPDAFADILSRSTSEWLWVPSAGEPSWAAPNVRVLEGRPFELVTCAGIEILALPHRSSFADYRRWDVPEKAGPRVALAHAPVITMPCLASDASGGAIDPDLFACHRVDYAALGSAHLTCAPTTYGTAVMADPGSARVTSPMEKGSRGGFLVDLDDDGVHPRWVAFAEAGQHREIAAPVAIDGSLPTVDTDGWSPSDTVALHLSGVLVDLDPATVERRARELWGAKVRRLDIDIRRLTSVSDVKLAALAHRLAEASGHDEMALRAREQCLALLVTAG